MSKHNKVLKEEKAKIVMIVLRGEKTVNEIASQYAVHPNLVSRWKQQAVTNMAELFEDERQKVDRKMYKESEWFLEKTPWFWRRPTFPGLMSKYHRR